MSWRITSHAILSPGPTGTCVSLQSTIVDEATGAPYLFGHASTMEYYDLPAVGVAAIQGLWERLMAKMARHRFPADHTPLANKGGLTVWCGVSNAGAELFGLLLAQMIAALVKEAGPAHKATDPKHATIHETL